MKIKHCKNEQVKLEEEERKTEENIMAMRQKLTNFS